MITTPTVEKTQPTMSRQKSTRILISIPDEFLNEVDNVASQEYRSRSDLIRQALRDYMRSMGNPSSLEDILLED
jgi:metal-responsive CopG/Arc/MetJ family transcriptional regulator